MRSESIWMRLLRLVWLVVAAGYLLVVMVVFPDYVRTSLAEFPLIQRVLSLLTVLISFGLAVMLYIQRRSHAVALNLSYFLLGWGLIYGVQTRILLAVFPGLNVVWGVLGTLVLGLILTVFLVRFPNGRLEPIWTRWLIVFSVLLLVAHTLYVLLRPTPNAAIDFVIESGTATPTLIALFASLWRYRHRATPLERRQMRWALYGIGLFFVIAFLAAIVIPQPAGGSVWFLAVNMMPVFFTIAVLRGHLWDIDLLIRRTLIYSIITSLLTGLYFGSVVLMQRLFRALTSQQSSLAVVISTLTIAALFTPLHNRVQRFVDRRFYRQKYDAQRTLEAFSVTMRDEVDLDRMTVKLVDAVEATMQPQQVSLWLNSGKS